MALPAVAGNTILASDLYQLARPSGGTEVGSYVCAGSSYVSGALLSYWVSSQSRAQTPVSVTIDTTIIAPLNCGTPSTLHLNANGFQVLANSNAVNASAGVGGAYTIQY